MARPQRRGLCGATRACLDESGRYLVSTGAWQRFAIWLLHKHFEPAAGEVSAERVIAAPRGTPTSLVERCSAPDLNPTSLRFDPLTGIAERLRAHGKTERFGVRLIRNPRGLSESAVLVETCDIAHRTLRCSVDERDDVSADSNVETTWQWKPSHPANAGALVVMLANK